MPTLRELRIIAQEEDISLHDGLDMILYVFLLTGHFDDVWVTQSLLDKGVAFARRKPKESQ